jgi:NAD(P)-dependent dehydrogenase (short-subunit alcohol dehydrogenase family)
MKKVILVTGVSSGFGKYTAELLANEGNIVYGTIRKEIILEPKINPLFMDLTDHSSILAGVEQITNREGRLDVLINNAGMHLGGPIELTPYDDYKRQIDTNLMGVIYLIQCTLPLMRRQGEGTIINISSIGGLMGLPYQGFYSASKFALEGFSESLRMEVKPFNIKVIVINPGDFHTHNTINRKNIFIDRTNNPYHDQFMKTLSVIEKDETTGLSPEILAKTIFSIIKCPNPRQRYLISTFAQKLAVKIKYILPANWFRRILESHYKIDSRLIKH